MKNILLVLIIAVSMIACKKEITTENSTMNSTTNDTIASESENSDSGTALMNAMKSMMDRMHQMNKTGNADYDLAASMQEHHQGAIDMSAAEISFGTDAKLKEMAQKMSSMQQKEIAELEAILSQSKSGGKNYEEDQGLGKAMMDNMMSMMKMPETSGFIDRDFATMMVKHHKDGIIMGNSILKYAKNSKFKSMTEKMIVDQNKDIKELESWLSEN